MDKNLSRSDDADHKCDRSYTRCVGNDSSLEVFDPVKNSLHVVVVNILFPRWQFPMCRWRQRPLSHATSS